MKFGKRLQQEASQRWPFAFVDYKALKKAIAEDCPGAQPGLEAAQRGFPFLNLLDAELARVSAAYDELELQLLRRADVASGLRDQAAALRTLRRDALDLRKVAVLNQLAVTKALKKARRHLGPESAPTRIEALTLLAPRSLFRSTRLAGLLTQVSLRSSAQARHAGDGQDSDDDVEDDFRCPICLDSLRSPVVLTCAHRFCWSCLLAYGQQLRQDPDASGKDGSLKPATTAAQASAAEHSLLQTQLSCPVCRQEHLLDLENLEIDTVFEAFLELLHGDRAAEKPADVAVEEASMDLDLPPGPAIADEADGAAPGDATWASRRAWAGPAPPAPTPPRRRSSARLSVEDSTGFDPVLPPLEIESARGLPERAMAASPAPSDAEQRPDGPSAASSAPLRVRTAAAEPAAPVPGGAPLLPPPAPEHRDKLVVCLDLDGTLVTTFSPARVPILPRGSVAYQVGEGSRLNPQGVVVVERPGLGEFLVRCARHAEVVLFTAGLEDYALPIATALESRYGRFAHRLYRPATVPSPEYPCVKDLSRLGRPLARTVLVDDTPLAFSFQPDNGVPVLQFRGDVDDRLLTEALLPLIETLADAADVRAPLTARFSMRAWFTAQAAQRAAVKPPPRRPGVSRVPTAPGPLAGADRGRAVRATATTAPAPPRPAAHAAPAPHPHAPFLILDFDQSLMHVDAQEYLCEVLAPELTSLLAVEHARASWIPATNAVWREMARRGVSPAAAADVAAALAREMPPASAELLRWAARERGWRCAVLSDCNSWLIDAVLGAAGLRACVHEVVTNPAAMGGGDDDAEHALLTVRPRQHGERAAACQHCPPNLCKGAELDDMLARLAGEGRGVGPSDHAPCPAPAPSPHQAPHQAPHPAPHQTPRPAIIYVGDGPNDLCPALRLGPGDFVLAREDFALDALLRDRAAEVKASVLRWSTHDQLLHLVQTLRLAVDG